MIIRYTIFLFWIATFSFAQTNIEQKLNDSSKIETGYSKGIFFLEQKDFEKAEHHFTTALASESTDSIKTANLHKALGKTFYYRNEFHKAKNEILIAIELFQQLKLDHELSSSMAILGNTYDELGQYKKALEWLNLSKVIREKDVNKIPLAHVLLNIGVVYDNLENYPLAIDHYIEAKAIYSALNDQRGISKCQNNLANIYKNQGYYEKALSEYSLSLKYHESNNNTRQMAMLYTNMALLYRYKNKREKEFDYYKKALIIHQNNDDKKGESIVYLNKGNSFLENNEFHNAKLLINKSLHLKESIDDTKGILLCTISLATTYFKVGSYDEAIKYCLKAEQLALNLGLNQSQIDIYELFVKIYVAKNNHIQAIEQLKKQNNLIEKNANKTLKRLTEVEINEHKSKSKALKKEVQLKNDKIIEFKENQVWLLSLSILIIVVLIVLFLMFRIRALKATHKSISIEQNLLRAQMSPHFAFNALGILQGIILNKEHSKSIVFISKFSKMLRFNLANSSSEHVKLSDEMDSIRAFVDLRNLSSNYQIRLNIKSTIQDTEHKLSIPTMLIQPFIENSINHGFKIQSTEDEIEIHLNMRGKNLVCRILDNGIGFEEYTKNQHEIDRPHALQIIQRRLELLSKKHNQTHRFEISKLEPKGTEVIFNLPYKLSKHD